MRLFHISEEPDIDVFEPRIPLRDDMDKSVGLVWAIDEKRLPNFLFPRECPRVCYYITEKTSDSDKEAFFPCGLYSHAVVHERRWYERIKNIKLYAYEFNPKDFELQDDVAGYYVAKRKQIPVAKHIITDVFSELEKRNVYVISVDSLSDIAEKVRASSLNWSLCRMRNAVK